MDMTGRLHAHEITPDDAAFIRMMAGAHFGPGVELTLPSGKTIRGDEMQQWVGPWSLQGPRRCPMCDQPKTAAPEPWCSGKENHYEDEEP